MVVLRVIEWQRYELSNGSVTSYRMVVLRVIEWQCYELSNGTFTSYRMAPL